jgi:DNA-directed RNA polymerase specialized sigma24 family protein
MTDSRSDTASLMREFAANESAGAFTELVRRYLPVVYGGALRRSGSVTIAEDVSQLVFIDFAQRLPSLRADERIGAW